MTTEQKRLTGTQAIREILERVKENPNGVGDSALDLHGIAVAELDAIESAGADSFERLPAAFRTRYGFILANPLRTDAEEAWWRGAREVLLGLDVDPGWELGPREPVPVTEDDLTALETLLASAKQGDVWAWLESARADVPKLLAEVRAWRARPMPEQVESAVDALVTDISDRSGLGNEWAGIPADVQREIREEWRSILMRLYGTQQAERVKELVAERDEARTELAHLQKHTSGVVNDSAQWEQSFQSISEAVGVPFPATAEEVASGVAALKSRADAAEKTLAQLKPLLSETQEKVQRLQDDSIREGVRRTMLEEGEQKGLELPARVGPWPRETPGAEMSTGCRRLTAEESLAAKDDVLTCPFCARLGLHPDWAPRSQWKVHADGLACPFVGHVCTPGLHLPEVPAQPVDVHALVTQVQSLPPELAQQLWSALGVKPT